MPASLAEVPPLAIAAIPGITTIFFCFHNFSKVIGIHWN
jgi:hypothetical protein